ncbi:hypothetical protein WME95_40980 [Sorangium sp. So ce327]|jgi:hypothetical protein
MEGGLPSVGGKGGDGLPGGAEDGDVSALAPAQLDDLVAYLESL